MLLPVLAHAFTLIASDSNQLRYRSDDSGQHVDATTTGSLTLNLRLKRTDWALSYIPSVSQLNAGESTSTLVFLNTGSLSAKLTLTPRTTLTWLETATYGRQNLQVLSTSLANPTASSGTGATTGGGSSSPQPSTPNTGQPSSSTPVGSPIAIAAPRNETISFGSLSSTVGFTQILDRKWFGFGSGSYLIKGQLNSSVDEAGQNVLYIPYSRTLMGTLTLARRLTARDGLSFSTQGSYTLTDPRTESSILAISAAWYHGLSKSTSMSLLGGASYAHTSDGLGTNQGVPLPFAQIDVNHRRTLNRGWLTISSGLSVMPIVDARYGTINEAVNSKIGLNWTKRGLTLSLAGYGSSSIDSVGQLSIFSSYGLLETVVYQLDRHWSVSAGSYQAWQKYSASFQSTAFWSAYVGIAYSTGRITL